MSIGIVQLSDIHIRVSGNSVCARFSEIKKAVQGVAHDITDLLLVVTGDVAFSGKQEEYTVAAEFLGAVESALRGLPAVNFLGTVVIPGNHDCDFENQGSVRTLLINSISNPTDISGAPPADFTDQILDVQKRFFDFEALVSSDCSLPANRLSWVREFRAGSGKMSVRCLNTAWMSQREEVRKLCFPISLASAAAPDADVVLTLFHHPYNWFVPENGRALRKVVETTSDVVLTGHEHDGDVYARVAGGGATTNYVEGAALQATGVENGFNYLKIDLAARTYQVHQFRWEGDMYSAAAVTSSVFTRNQALLEHRFINEESFKKILEDVGTPFSHPVKTDLRLRDLFIYPDLRVLKLGSMSEKAERVVNSADVLAYAHEKKKVIIAGQPTSGKTSLAKILYEDFQHVRKLVPVLLSVSDLRGADPSHVAAAVAKAFERQYSRSLLERFTQLDPDSKIAVVDDWHKIKFNLKGRRCIVTALEKIFGRIVLFTDDASILRQVSEVEESDCFAEFAHCEIKQFGCRLRGELVMRWHSLGRELEVDEMEFTHAVATSENLLDTLIGKGVLPSYPVYVFSVLQASDHSAGQNVSYGSYGHIYESLLTTRMARVNKRNLGQKYTYLSIIAYRMFRAGRAVIGPNELKELDGEYWDDYMMSVDQGELLDELVKSQILYRSGDDVSFQYKYAYYFFVAKYFQEGMANVTGADGLSARLRQMADAAYDDENARILIFYLYLTKDRPLIEHILENAAGLFADQGVCDLKEDVAFVNALYSARPTLVMPSENTRKNREEFRSQRDAMSEGSEPQSLNKSADSLQIDLAFESLQILGQVLRNFPGNLRADLKLRLARESYELGLRSLRKFLRDIETNFGKLREHFLRHLREHKNFARRDIDEVRRTADKLVIGLSELGILAIIKKVSFSVGLEDLRDIYKAVRSQAGEDHVPTRLIDLSITLDHFGHLPVSDVRDLEHRIGNNVIVQTVLRILVAEHLALFPVQYKTRQAMVQLFNFQPRALLILEKKVKQLTG